VEIIKTGVKVVKSFHYFQYMGIQNASKK